MQNPTMKSCPICGGLGETEREVEGYRLLRCGTCGFVYVNATDREIEQVNLHYDDDAKAHYRAVQSSIDSLWFDRISARLTRGRQGLRVLDIGCGNGMLLRRFQERGCICYGSDPSPWARDCAREYGYTLVGAVEEASIETERFDIVTSTSTLEHIARPLEHVERIMDILKPGGEAYFTVPNYGSLPIRLHLVKGRLVSPPGHCNYFTRRTLRNLFMQEGLKDQVAKVRVRSYGIPEIHGVYGWFSKRKAKATPGDESRRMRRIHLKRALVNAYYWTGAPFGLGDKLEAWVEKARLSNANSPAR